LDAVVSAPIVVALFTIFLWLRREKRAAHPPLQARPGENRPTGERIAGITGQMCTKPGLYRSVKDPIQSVTLHAGATSPPGVASDGVFESAAWELTAPSNSPQWFNFPYTYVKGIWSTSIFSESCCHKLLGPLYFRSTPSQSWRNQAACETKCTVSRMILVLEDHNLCRSHRVPPCHFASFVDLSTVPSPTHSRIPKIPKNPANPDSDNESAFPPPIPIPPATGVH